MVEQMMDYKQNECGVVNPGSGLFTCAKQQLTELKKTALRDLQNDNRIVSPQNTANRGPATDDGVKVSGTKRPAPECSMGPPCRQSSSGNGTSGNLVYIRRKSEQEVDKSNTCDNIMESNPQIASDLNHTQKKNDQDFKERFLRLQAFLKSYDHSSQEEYIQMLRALPSVGRSKHAVGLEKRAIQLLLEEKKELERMKVLNVLGKSTPKDNTPPSTTTQAPSGK